jgi:GcrA cell cycle regulator
MQQNWTDRKLASLKRLWRDGKTAAAIAQRLGVSKAAVLGKIFRLRLPLPAPKPGRPASSSTQRRKGGPLKVEGKLKQGIKRGKSLLELTNESCRWPIGDPSKKSFHFCGEPGADLEQGVPYCERHSQRAYQHSADKERRAENFLFAARGNKQRFGHCFSSAAVQRLFRVALARRVRT